MDSTISTVKYYPLYNMLSTMQGSPSTTSTAMKFLQYSPQWMQMQVPEAACYSTLGLISNSEYLSTVNRFIPPMVVELHAGLGNRLKALVSGMCAAEDLGKDLRAVWGTSAECGAKFTDLFDLSGNPLPARVYVHEALQAGYTQQTVETQEQWDSVKDVKTVIYTKSGSRFHKANDAKFVSHLQNLKPQAWALAAVTRALATAGTTNVVGVHLRRTEYTAAAPTSAFMGAMQGFDASTKFFVASDSDSDRQALEAAFPGRIITVAETLARGNKEGMEDALKDFVGLSKCSEILGSEGSSFSEMAALYGGVKLTVVT